MTIHPEDVHAYADQLHRDLDALTAAVDRIAELLGQIIRGDESVRFVSGEDRP